MITKLLGWCLVAIILASIVWWRIDPVGFSHNPVVSYFQHASMRSSGYYR